MARFYSHRFSSNLFLTKNQQLKSLYIGNGRKFEQEIYFPKFPFTILSEPKERNEEIEPNGELPVAQNDIKTDDDQVSVN